MLSRTIFKRSASVRNLLTLAMQESQRNRQPGRRGKPRAPNGGQPSNRGHYSTAAAAVANAPPPPPLTIAVPEDTPRFSDLAKDNLVHPVLLQTISENMKWDHMTPVQSATIYELLKDRRDVLAQAKTGTGKTAAFLVPSIQTMINRQQKPGAQASLLVISPTRELALQIANEARALLQRMPQFSVCTAIGGTNKDSEERKILKGCDILIGTPGRLLDHFTSQDGRGQSQVAEKMGGLHTMVLDEADRLLDMGFLNDLKKIISCLPNKEQSGRQGLCFSATVPEYVDKVAQVALAKDYKYISTISKGEVSTHERVPQQLITVPNFSDISAGLVGILRQEIAHIGPDKFKAIVFCGTAALCDFYSELLQRLQDLPKPISLHSRLTQSKRTRITEDFRSAKSGILIATDVIARGMDFPSVTNVIQVGIPSDKESYIHRLGRTARAGAEGRGTFIVSSHESYFPKYVLKDITFVDDAAVDLSAHDEVKRIAEKMDPDTQTKAYQAWLGFYKTSVKALGWDTGRLVQEANKLALEGLGCAEIPTLKKSVVGKMGLKGVRGLVIGPDPPKPTRGGNASGGWGAQRNDDGPSNKRQRY